MIANHEPYAEIIRLVKQFNGVELTRDEIKAIRTHSMPKNTPHLPVEPLRAAGSTIALEEAIKSLVNPIDRPVKRYASEPIGRYPMQCTLVLSDTHIGKATDSYDTETAVERICLLINGAIAHATELYGRMSNYNIVFAGDIVDGISIYPKQPHYIDRTLLGQIFDGIADIVNAIAEASTQVDNINIYGTYGNHGRLSKYFDELSNLDLMFLKALQLGCQNISNITFDISNQSLHVFNLGGWHKTMVCHGHDVAGGSPNAIQNRVIRWLATEQYKDIDLFIFGHFHSPINYQCQRSHVIVNGSTVTGDRYAIEKMGLSTQACQTSFICSDKNPAFAITYYRFPDNQ